MGNCLLAGESTDAEKAIEATRRHDLSRAIPVFDNCDIKKVHIQNRMHEIYEQAPTPVKQKELLDEADVLWLVAQLFDWDIVANKQSKDDTSGNTRYIIRGLAEETEYYVRISAKNETNPNSITNCFKLFSLLQLTTTLLLRRFLIFILVSLTKRVTAKRPMWNVTVQIR